MLSIAISTLRFLVADHFSPFPAQRGGPGPGLSIPKLLGSAWNNRGPVFGTNGPLVNGALEQDYSEVAVVLVRFAMAQLDWRTWKIGLG
jgi:hypothetical protein